MANISKRKPQVQKMLEERIAGQEQNANSNSAARSPVNPTSVERQLGQIKPKRISRQKGEK